MVKRPADSDEENNDPSVDVSTGSARSKRTRLNGASNLTTITSNGARDSDGDDADELDELDEDEASQQRPPLLPPPPGDGGDSDAESEVDPEEEAYITQGAAELGRHRERGIIAEAGILDKIILKNFMCHKHLEVTFGPQINFIIGHNGSGKSVVLAAITFGFGAKAAVTNRAASQKDFVQRGATYAEVALSVRNRGEEAYRPEVYGKTIWIIRRVTANGSSTFKIQNAEKVTVSTKREEVASICDFFMIQVENPINILNQDMAKEFIRSKSAQEKYRMFLKGTQLAQLTEEYNAINERTIALKSTVGSHTDKVKLLKNKCKEAATAWKEIEKARMVETQIRIMKNELAWTKVQETEKDVAKAVDNHMDAEDIVRKATRLIKELKDNVLEAEAAVNDARKDDAANDNNDLQDEQRELTVRKREIGAKIKRVKDEQRRSGEGIKNLQINIKEYNVQIEAARKMLDGSERERVLRARAELEELHAKRKEITEKVARCRSEMGVIDEQADKDRKARDAADHEQRAARDALQHNETIIASLRARQADDLMAYGPQAPRIIAAINSARWRNKPIGPVGRYVTLKDRSCSRLCESVLGETLNAFIVTNEEDRLQLKNIIQDVRGKHSIYLVESDANWDFSGGLPRGVITEPNGNLQPYKFVTLLDVLDITDRAVFKLLVDSAKIECSVIVDSPKEGDRIMRFNAMSVTNIVNCYSKDCYKLGGLGGGARTQALNEWRGHTRLTQDVELDKRRAQEEHQGLEARLREAAEQYKHFDRQLANLAQSRRKLENDAGAGSGQLRQLVVRIENLKEDTREEEPPNIRALEDSITEATRQIDSARSQDEAADAHVSDLKQEAVPISQRLEAIAAMLDQRIASMNERQGVLEKAVAAEVTARDQLRKREDQLLAKRELVAEKEAKLRQMEEKLQNDMDLAAGMCPRAEVNLDKGKKVSKYETDIKSLEKALRAREAAVGGDSETIHKRYIAAKKEYEVADATTRDLRECISALRTAYNIRVDRWMLFRNHIGQRARMQFIHHLTMRGFEGDLKFRHDQQKLVMEVNPTESAIKTLRIKDPATLSGGEASFSTVCLLLALWQSAGCPIRGLDEYDVYLDSVNRGVATKMLIEAGQTSNNTQMILISPQAMAGGHATAAGVKIIKIADPERGQGTLAAGTLG